MQKTNPSENGLCGSAKVVDKIHNKVFITVDVMLINKMTLMVSVWSKIKLNTIENIENINKVTLLGVIDTIIAHLQEKNIPHQHPINGSGSQCTLRWFNKSTNKF